MRSERDPNFVSDTVIFAHIAILYNYYYNSQWMPAIIGLEITSELNLNGKIMSLRKQWVTLMWICNNNVTIIIYKSLIIN